MSMTFKGAMRFQRYAVLPGSAVKDDLPGLRVILGKLYQESAKKELP